MARIKVIQQRLQKLHIQKLVQKYTSQIYISFSIYIFIFIQSAWEKLEDAHWKKYKETFPECVKKILIHTGFENGASLQNITRLAIEDIESYVNTHRELLQDLDCCFSETYGNMIRFEFMPGHIAIINSIPALISTMNGKPKKKKSEQFVKNQLINLLRKTLSVAAKIHNRTNVDVWMINDENLYEFELNGDETTSDSEYKCRFMCPYCDKTFGLTYNRFWRSSKVTKHLKVHIAGF